MRFNIQMVILTTVGILLLSACGGGGSNGIESNETLIPNPNIAKEIVMCDTNNTTNLSKGDKVTALTDDTEVSVIHKQDSTKTACVIKGQATVTSAP